MREERFLEDDFSSYLQELIDMKALDGPALGITKQTIDKGFESLTPKQKHVFIKDVIDPNSLNECGLCPNDIPWCEMTAAVENGGYCSWCKHQLDKED
jgi:hypothetical protein